MDGEMPPYLLAKDLILQIIGEISVVGATYKAMEFVGTMVESLNKRQLFRVCSLLFFFLFLWELCGWWVSKEMRMEKWICLWVVKTSTKEWILNYLMISKMMPHIITINWKGRKVPGNMFLLVPSLHLSTMCFLAMVTDTQKNADMVANLAVVDYDKKNLEPILSIEEAFEKCSFYEVPPLLNLEPVVLFQKEWSNLTIKFYLLR
ncbi:hypothetical protein J1N35_005712 [Gossypium stocksii]|uniref:Aconitase/3-isopropylmalate dehydratase large subunit alpha/beta/alpha domain-containing protein n=1 Tax=Gossypium stocksii TaxID=47602 RepID=A0A9D4AHC9_9ROSI|nr:hypothetical protein J1N35_005712 [Gossypium stocksii]